MTDHCVYLALGSNMGDRHAIMSRAIDEIGRLIGVVERRSVFLETEPWGFDSPNRFLNACVRCRTTLTPREEQVLRMRFGLTDGKPHTLEEVGKEFDVTRERIRQIESKALRKLRHPSRSKKLRDFLN